MSFKIRFTDEAQKTYSHLGDTAKKIYTKKVHLKKQKTSKQEGLYKQIHKTIALLSENPKHPSLKTHIFVSLINPLDSEQKVFEAYVQNNTPGAYRVFWCYGPDKKEITIIAITPHP